MITKTLESQIIDKQQAQQRVQTPPLILFRSQGSQDADDSQCQRPDHAVGLHVGDSYPNHRQDPCRQRGRTTVTPRGNPRYGSRPKRVLRMNIINVHVRRNRLRYLLVAARNRIGPLSRFVSPMQRAYSPRVVQTMNCSCLTMGWLHFLSRQHVFSNGWSKLTPVKFLYVSTVQPGNASGYG